MYIEKRNGDFAPFDGNKISKAINKALNEVENHKVKEEDVDNIIKTVADSNEEHLTVEQIQDIVVDMLMPIDPNVAKAYQGYRAVRHESRKRGESIIKEVNGIISGDSEKLSENANKDSRTISVQRDILAGISSKEIYLNNILPKTISNAHKENRIHVHDLDYLLFRETNCELVHLERMLKGGCKIGNADMDEPKSVEVAVGHTVQIVAAVSSNTYGGCTIPYLDRALTPYIRKTFVKHWNTGVIWLSEENEDYTELEFNPSNDKYFEKDWETIYDSLKEKNKKVYRYARDLTKEAVKQALQGLEYEINSLSTVNGQTPFTTIGIGTETSWEGKMVQKFVLRNRAAGFGKGKKRTAIFPKISFATCPGHNMNPGDINYDVYKEVLKCMSKAIYPDILFVTKEQIENGTVVYGMGCRAYLSPWWNVYGEEVYNGRFNLGATSINLPKIAINAKGNLQDFYNELDEVLEICRENCMFRAKYMEDTPSDIAPILWQAGALAELEPGETIKDLIWGGYATISIGYIGLSEVSRLMFGKDFAEDEKSYKETYAILSYIKGRIEHFKKEDNLGYALYATPSESLCDRFAKNDLAKYGSIEGITDKGYYENSFHVASNIEIDPFNKMRLEGKAHSISTGGHISYIETPSLINNLQALDGLIRVAYDAGVHYFGVNQPIDHCFECGFKGEFLPTVEGYKCPSCGNQNSQTISVIRRVCGYLAQPDARPFNAGKQQEVINRTNHITNENGSLKKTHA